MSHTSIIRLFQRYGDKILLSPALLLPSKAKKRVTRLPAGGSPDILIVKLWALGDSLLLLAALNKLRERLPQATISVLASNYNRCVFDSQPSVDRVLTFRDLPSRLMKKRFDFVVDAEPWMNVSALIARLSGRRCLGFSHGQRSRCYDEVATYQLNRHMVENYSHLLRLVAPGLKTPSCLAPLRVTKSHRAWAKSYLARAGIGNGALVVGLAPGVGGSVKERKWPAHRFSALADRITRRHGATIVVFGGPENRRDTEDVCYSMREKVHDFSGKLSIFRTAALMERCSLVVSNDSGLMHLAAAHNIRTIGLFGPSSPLLWRPYGVHHLALSANGPSSAYNDNRYHRLIPCRLSLAQREVMNAISVDSVLTSVDLLLHRP